MNKGITLLVLVALLGAMGLVLYSHSGSKEEPAADARPAPVQSPQVFTDSGPASPLQAPQGDSGGLARIEPPISGSSSAPEGAPVPVTLGPDGRQPRPEPAPLPPAVPAPPKPKPEPKAETKPEAKKEAPPKTAAPTPPAASQADKKTTPQPDKKPAPPESKPPSGAPGLTPWTSPPGQGGASAQAPVPPPPATTAEAPTPQPSAAPPPEQRLATDPIRPTHSPGSAHRLTAISLVPAGQAMRLRIEASAPFTVKTFVLTGPDRLVIDLPGTWQGMKAPSLPQNNVVGKVRLGQQPSGPRLVLDLKSPLKNHRAEASGNAVEILVQ